MKAILDQAISGIEQLQSNLYRVRFVLGEIRNPAEWNENAQAGIDTIKSALGTISQQVAEAQAQLAGILQQRAASEKGLGILVEEMAALVAAIDRVQGNLNLKEAA